MKSAVSRTANTRQIAENVRGRDVFVVQSLYGDASQSVNDKLCRLLFFIGALKDASACLRHRDRSLPGLCAQGPEVQDARPGHHPLCRRACSRPWEQTGVVTMDVHNLAAYQNAFRCRTDHLQANGCSSQHFAPLLRGRQVVVVSPDAGGIKRAERFRQRLGAGAGRPVAAAFAEKHRSEDVVSGELIVGDVQGPVRHHRR